MAIATTQQVLHNGVRNLVVQLTGVSDGSGNEDHVTKVDISALGAEAISLRKICYDIDAGLVKLSWDAPTPVDFALLSHGGALDYQPIGGIKNSGDILLTTSGFELDSSYTIVLEMRKS